MGVGATGVIAVFCGVALVLAWSLDRARSAASERARREAACAHRPEWQETIRINTHPLGWVVPSRRMLVKQCRGCGRQHPVYRSLQSWDAYVAEFRQETRDRTAEFRARRRIHLSERARAGRSSQPPWQQR